MCIPAQNASYRKPGVNGKITLHLYSAILEHNKTYAHIYVLGTLNNRKTTSECCHAESF